MYAASTVFPRKGTPTGAYFCLPLFAMPGLSPPYLFGCTVWILEHMDLGKRLAGLCVERADWQRHGQGNRYIWGGWNSKAEDGFWS